MIFFNNIINTFEKNKDIKLFNSLGKSEFVVIKDKETFYSSFFNGNSKEIHLDESIFGEIYSGQDFDAAHNLHMDFLNTTFSLLEKKESVQLHWNFHGISVSSISDSLYSFCKDFVNEYDESTSKLSIIVYFLRYITNHLSLNFVNNKNQVIDIFEYLNITDDYIEINGFSNLLSKFWTGEITINNLNFYDFCECFYLVKGYKDFANLSDFIVKHTKLSNF